MPGPVISSPLFHTLLWQSFFSVLNQAVKDMTRVIQLNSSYLNVSTWYDFIAIQYFAFLVEEVLVCHFYHKIVYLFLQN
jgi:hypothetical protein